MTRGRVTITVKDGSCPNCGGVLEPAGKGLVRCRYCGTEIYLSPAVVSPTGFEPGISAGEPRGEAGDLGDLSPPDEGMRS